MTDALLANVSALAGQMRELARQAHAGYAAEVDAVIAARSRDVRHIERLLDGILDFGFDAAMVQLFKRLCRYYYTLDPAATASYVYTYLDMWDNEGEEGGTAWVKHRPTFRENYLHPSKSSLAAKRRKKLKRQTG